MKFEIIWRTIGDSDKSDVKCSALTKMHLSTTGGTVVDKWTSVHSEQFCQRSIRYLHQDTEKVVSTVLAFQKRFFVSLRPGEWTRVMVLWHRFDLNRQLHFFPVFVSTNRCTDPFSQKHFFVFAFVPFFNSACANKIQFRAFFQPFFADKPVLLLFAFFRLVV